MKVLVWKGFRKPFWVFGCISDESTNLAAVSWGHSVSSCVTWPVWLWPQCADWLKTWKPVLKKLDDPSGVIWQLAARSQIRSRSLRVCKSESEETLWWLTDTKVPPTGMPVWRGWDWNLSWESKDCKTSGQSLRFTLNKEAGMAYRSLYKWWSQMRMYGRSCVNHIAIPMAFSRRRRDVRFPARRSLRYWLTFWILSSGTVKKPELIWKFQPIHLSLVPSSHFFQEIGTWVSRQKIHKRLAVQGRTCASWKMKKSSTYSIATCDNQISLWKMRSRNAPSRLHQAAEKDAPKGQTR